MMHGKHWLIPALALALLTMACGPDETSPGAADTGGAGAGAQQEAPSGPAGDAAPGAGSDATVGGGNAAAGTAGESAVGAAPGAGTDATVGGSDAGGSAARAAGPYACIPGDAKAGGVHYQTLCASCHGQDGGGDGPAAAALEPKPASHRDGAHMNALSNAHLTRVIAKGGAAAGKSPLMAPFGEVLGEAGVQDVTAFVRTLAAPPYACP